VRIIETFAKNDRRPLEGTVLSTMDGILTHKAASSAEEQICICIRKPMEHIESITVHGYRDMRRKG
jgi:hypothetical protein